MLFRFPLRALVAATGACAAAAHAQQAPAVPPVPQAGQVTPRDLRPELAPKPPAAVPRAAPENAPAHADQLFVSAAAIVVDGAFPELADATTALLPPYTGRRAAVSEFYELAAHIEAMYQAAGYPLVRVLVPPQKLADGGTLHLTVLDGFVERVDVQAVAPAARDAVALTMAPLVGRRHLRAAELERALTLAGRVPGVTLRSALGAGKQTGGVVLVLEGEAVGQSISLSADDRLTGSLGPWEMTAQLRLNQPLGWREQEYIYASSGPDLSKLDAKAARKVVGGGVIVPLGTSGLQFNPEFTWSQTDPNTPPTAVRTESKFTRYTLRLSYPLILDHAQELTLTSTFDATSQTNAAPDFGLTLSDDRVRVGRLGLDWMTTLPAGHVHAYATGSQGLRGFGARTPSDIDASGGVPFSRAGMDAGFTKLELGVTFDQPLPFALQSTLSVRGQLAKGVLPSSELFSLDGEDALSTYTSGALSDDSGFTAREELGWSTSLSLGGRAVGVAPYVFGAIGSGTSKLPPDPLVGPASSYGVGLRSSFDNVSAAAEFGHHEHGGEPDGAQFFFKVQVQF